MYGNDQNSLCFRHHQIPFCPGVVNSRTNVNPPSIASSFVMNPPKLPERPLMPYMRFSRKVYGAVKSSNPQLKFYEVGEKIGQMWRELAASEKQTYIDEYDAEKLDYAVRLRNYQSSPAYQQYLVARERALQEENARNATAADVKHVSRLSVPPCDLENENDLDYFTASQLAATRFKRNNSLMERIFDDVILPDERKIVSKNQIDYYNRRKNTVISTQKAVETEIINMEKKFQSNKRKMEESLEKFELEISKRRNPADNVKMFQVTVAEEQRKILFQYRNQLKRVHKDNNGNSLLIDCLERNQQQQQPMMRMPEMYWKKDGMRRKSNGMQSV